MRNVSFLGGEKEQSVVAFFWGREREGETQDFKKTMYGDTHLGARLSLYGA